MNIITEQPFIWTEHDRITGYLKLDMVDLFLYTVKDHIESIIDDPNILNPFLALLPANERSNLEIYRTTITEQCHVFIDQFWNRWEFVIKQETSFRNSSYTPLEITQKANELLYSLADFEDIRLAFAASIALLGQPIDELTRYPNKEIIPYCVPLASDEDVMHQLFMNHLFKYYRQVHNE